MCDTEPCFALQFAPRHIIAAHKEGAFSVKKFINGLDDGWHGATFTNFLRREVPYFGHLHASGSHLESVATCASWLTLFALGPVFTDWHVSESTSLGTRGLIVGAVVLVLAVLIAVMAASAEVRELARKPVAPQGAPIRSKRVSVIVASSRLKVVQRLRSRARKPRLVPMAKTPIAVRR